jgi:hypothetical protein
MNANSVLNKIVTLLTKEEVKMTYAKLEDGTIVESPTFDVGEPVEVVTEEGKTPAPNGEHDLFLRDEAGNEVHIRVITEEGVIVERENVEEMEEEIVKVDSEVEEKAIEEMAEETIETEPLPGEPESEMTKMEEVDKKMEEMAYRIEELEKTIAKMQEVEIEIGEEEDEEEVSPMNGAPVEMSKVSVKLNKSKSIRNPQSSFLAKLYN